MSDLLRQAVESLAELRGAFASASVTYRRGASSVELPATIGRTVFRFVDTDGNYFRQGLRDFLVASADLDFGSGPIVPRRGDFVDVPLGDRVYRWEVNAINGEAVYRMSDPQGVTLRIHAIEKGLVE